MKYLLFGAALLGAAPLARAQVGAGTILLSADAGYSQTSQNQQISPHNSATFLTQRTTTLPLQLTGGYFVADNLLLGVQASYISGNEIQPLYSVSTDGRVVSKIGENKTKGHSLALGPTGRYYHFLNPQLALYGQLGGGYLRRQVERLIPSDLDIPEVVQLAGGGFYGQLSPGLVFFPVPRLGVELNLLGLHYQRTSLQAENTNYKTVSSTFGAGLGLRYLRLGLSVYLGRQ